MPYEINYLILIVAALLLSFSVHELSHAWVANRLGDPTARLDGRISINPLAHWDPIGTTMLVVLIFLGLPAFGWGKPVPINDRNFTNPKKDLLISSIAGPISNILLAFFFIFILRLLLVYNQPELAKVIFTAIYINFYLAIFNLIPLPPLDGSQILRAVVPDSTYEKIEANSSMLLIALIGIIMFFPGIITSLVDGILKLIHLT